MKPGHSSDSNGAQSTRSLAWYKRIPGVPMVLACLFRCNDEPLCRKGIARRRLIAHTKGQRGPGCEADTKAKLAVLSPEDHLVLSQTPGKIWGIRPGLSGELLSYYVWHALVVPPSIYIGQPLGTNLDTIGVKRSEILGVVSFSCWDTG